MGVRACNEDDLELLRAKRDRAAAGLLLNLLKEHHDYSVPKPPPAPAFPVKVVKAPTPAPASVDLPPPTPTLAQVRRAVLSYFRMDYVDFISNRRVKSIVYPRQISFYLANSLTRSSLKGIGMICGGKDHTTVLHGIRVIEQKIKEDWRVAFDVAAIEATI